MNKLKEIRLPFMGRELVGQVMDIQAVNYSQVKEVVPEVLPMGSRFFMDPPGRIRSRWEYSISFINNII